MQYIYISLNAVSVFSVKTPHCLLPPYDLSPQVELTGIPGNFWIDGRSVAVKGSGHCTILGVSFSTGFIADDETLVSVCSFVPLARSLFASSVLNKHVESKRCDPKLVSLGRTAGRKRLRRLPTTIAVQPHKIE